MEEAPAAFRITCRILSFLSSLAAVQPVLHFDAYAGLVLVVLVDRIKQLVRLKHIATRSGVTALVQRCQVEIR